MIPNIPVFYNDKYTESDGFLSGHAKLYSDQLNQSINYIVTLINLIAYSSISADRTLTLDGITPPSKTTAQITAIEPNVNNGTIWFNTNLSKLQVKTAPGVVQTIQSV